MQCACVHIAWHVLWAKFSQIGLNLQKTQKFCTINLWHYVVWTIFLTNSLLYSREGATYMHSNEGKRNAHTRNNFKALHALLSLTQNRTTHSRKLTPVNSVQGRHWRSMWNYTDLKKNDNQWLTRETIDLKWENQEQRLSQDEDNSRQGMANVYVNLVTVEPQLTVTSLGRSTAKIARDLLVTNYQGVIRCVLGNDFQCVIISIMHMWCGLCTYIILSIKRSPR